MAQETNIEWTDKSWNFLRGCSRVSEGCRNCYAERTAIRFAKPGEAYQGLVQSTPGGPKWTGKVEFFEHILLEPLKWRKPCLVFVNSMSDLFHEKVTDEMLDKAFAVMALTPHITYQILTKRPERMNLYLMLNREQVVKGKAWTILGYHPKFEHKDIMRRPWPLPNVHLGVSVENQKTADERIPLLLQTPAAVRWVSYEPALGPVDLRHIHHDDTVEIDALTGDHGVIRPLQGRSDKHLDWIVVGGESGPGARPFDIQWARDIIAHCKAADVPVFVKQLGAKPYETFNGTGTASISLEDRKGGDMSEWPEDLCVRQMPEVVR